MRLAGDREIEVLELEGDPERRALVLLHEGLGSVGLWRGFPRALAEATGRRLIAFSRFGHGRSQPPAGPRTPAFFHEEALDVLPAVLEDLHAPEPILVGHSDGGSIALIHAAQRPVTGVVLIAPHVVVEEMTLAAIRRTRAAYATDGLRERMARHHRDPGVTFRNWNDVWLSEEFRAWDLRPLLAGITAPVLAIQGTADPYGTVLHVEAVRDRASGPVELLVLDCAHAPHHEATEAVTAAVVRLLAVLPDARA